MNESAAVRPVRVLLVDDNPGDVRLLEEAFAEARVANEVTAACRYQEAVDRLHGRGDYADGDRPDVVLTAVHLPDGTGADLVAAVKGTPSLADIPVVMLTVSPSERSVLGDNRADGHLRKPVDGDEFVDLCRAIGSFWVQVVVPADDGD